MAGSGQSSPFVVLRRATKVFGLMSVRPVKRIVQSKPTIEGAGVRLRRAFGFGETSETDPFCCWTIFAMTGRPTTWPDFRGIRTAASKP